MADQGEGTAAINPGIPSWAPIIDAPMAPGTAPTMGAMP